MLIPKKLSFTTVMLVVSMLAFTIPNVQAATSNLIAFNPSTPPVITSITVNPLSFNPSNSETASIYYVVLPLSSISTDTVQILDSNNTVQKTLIETPQKNAWCSTTSCEVHDVWDGRDNNGNILPPGTYTVKAISTYNNTTASNSTTISITSNNPTNNIPIVTSVTTSSSSFIPSSNETINIYYTFGGNQNQTPTTEMVQILDNNNTVRRTMNQPAGQAYCTNGGSCELHLSWDGRDDSANILPPGVYTVKASGTNSSGTGSNSVTVNITNPVANNNIVNNSNSSNRPVFTDVTSNSPYYNALTYLKAQSIVSGYSDGSFKPDTTINRAEFTKIVVGSLNPNYGSCADSLGVNYPYMFSDLVPANSDGNPWYMSFICYAKNNNLVSGYQDGTFRPNQNINFAEAAKIIINADKLPIAGTTTADPWYKKYVETLASLNAIPTTITHFDQQITRGEMAEIIFRLQTKNTSLSSQMYANLQ